MSLKVAVDGYDVKVERILIKNILTGKKEYSTSISQLLENIIDLPWKEWLGSINWHTASGEVSIINGKITVTDTLGELANCTISDIDIGLTGDDDDLAFSFSCKSTSPASKSGTVAIDLEAKLNSETPKSVNNFFASKAHLAFIKDITINGDISNLDLPYLLKYYGLGSKLFDNLRIELTDPLNASFSFKSDTMADVDFKANFFSKKILALYYGMELMPDVPEITMNIAGNFNFLHEWTEFSKLGVDVLLQYPDSEVCSFHAQGNGSFGDNIILTVNSNTNLSEISKSRLGKYFNFRLFGELDHTAAFNWSISKPWRLNYSLIGKNVATDIDGERISSKVRCNLDGVLEHNTRFEVESGTFNFDLAVPFLTLKTSSPVNLNFTKLALPSKTSLDFSVDLERFHSSFRNVFKKMGIHNVDEIVAGKIDIDDKQNLTWHTALYSKHDKAKDPFSFTGSLRPSGEKVYLLKADFHNNNKTVDLKADSKITRLDKGWGIELSQSGVLNLDSFYKLYERYQVFFADRKLPLVLHGKVTEAVNASAKITDDKISLGISSRLSVDDFSTVVNKYPIEEKIINCSSSFSLNMSDSNKLLKIDNFSLSTDESKVSFNAGAYDLDIIKTRDWRKALKAFPNVDVKVDVGNNILTTIGGTIGNSIANKYLEGATVKGVFSSAGATKSTFSSFKYTAPLLSVESQDVFTIDPLAMTEIIIAKDFFNIHKSLSDVDLLVSADMNEWKGIIPEVATEFIGKYRFNAKYYQENDRLQVRSFGTESTSERVLVVPELEFSGSLLNFFDILQHFTFSKFASSIDNNLNVKKLKLAVNQLKLLAGNNPGSTIRALQGEHLLFDSITLKHSVEKDYLSVRGNATGKMSFFSRSSKWPVLAVAGSVKSSEQGIVLKINPDSIAAKGGFDFKNSKIEFNALSPYHYNKKLLENMELLFYGMLHNNGDATVKEAKIVGGPLEVELAGMKHKSIGPRYKLSVESINIGKPLNTEIKNLLLNSSADILKGEIKLGYLDFAELQSNLNISFPINISGSLNGGNIKINDSYWRYFAPFNSNIEINRNSENDIELGGADIRLSSSDSAAVIAFSVAGGRGSSLERSIIFDDVKVESPAGYSDRPAILAESVSIAPDLRSVFSDRIIINRIGVNKMEAYYEMSALKKSNISALEDNLKGVFSSGGKVSTGMSREVLIHDIYITDSQVRLSSSLLGGKVSLPIPLDIHLQNIGGENAGSTFTSVFGKIFAGIGKVTSGVVGGVGGAVGVVGSTVKGVGKIGKSIIKAPFKLIKSFEGDGDKNNASGNEQHIEVIESEE